MSDLVNDLKQNCVLLRRFCFLRVVSDSVCQAKVDEALASVRERVLRVQQ